MNPLAILGVIGQAVSGFFGFKGQQADTVKTALQVLGDTNTSNAQREQAVATIIAGEAASDSPITRVWRPLAMLVFLVDLHIMLWALITGNFPKELMATLPPIMERVFDLITIGIGGYIGGRTLEKIISQINIGGVLKQFISKKLG